MGRVIVPETEIVGPGNKSRDRPDRLRNETVVCGKRSEGSVVAVKRKEERDGRRQDPREREATDRADSRA